MSTEIFNTLKAFIIQQSAVEDKEVIRSAGIEEDLGIYGDDAMDFIIAYAKAFNVDITKFMAADYFSDEGDPLLPAITRFLTNSKKRKTKILTVGHLEKAIIAGRLDEAIISR